MLKLTHYFHKKNVVYIWFNYFGSESACEGKKKKKRAAKQSQTCVFFFFFTADFIAYVLYLQSTKSDIRYVQTDHHPEKDVIETVLHSEGLTEERLFTHITPLLPNQTPCLGHSEMFEVCKRSHIHPPVKPRLYFSVKKTSLLCILEFIVS